MNRRLEEQKVELEDINTELAAQSSAIDDLIADFTLELEDLRIEMEEQTLAKDAIIEDLKLELEDLQDKLVAKS